VRSVVPVFILLAGLLALPTAASAAGTCELTSSVSPGHVITIVGSGFPASTDIEITQTWGGSNATAGGNTGPQTTTSQVTSDATGAFEFTIDAGPGRGGTYDVEAAAGGCTASTRAVAVESAGGLNPGSGATPPATDTAYPVGQGASAPVVPLVVVTFGLALALGLALVRRSRTRGVKA
jgi:hypothetical protein